MHLLIFRFFLPILTVVAASLLVPIARAADTSEILIRQGVELRKDGKDAQAFDKFVQAYQIAHTPRAAAQLGLCESALRRWVEADLHLTEALAAQSDPWVRGHRAALESTLDRVRSHLGFITLKGTPPQGTVTVNDAVLGQLRDQPALRVVPGEAKVEVRAAGFQIHQSTLNLEAGEKKTIEVHLAPAEVLKDASEQNKALATATVVDSTQDRPHTQNGWRVPVGIGLAVGAAAAATFGIISHLGRESKASDFNAKGSGCDRSGNSILGGEGCQNLANDYDSLSTRMWIGYATAGGFAIGSVILLWPKSPDARRAERSGCSPAWSGLGVSCAGTF